VLDFADEKGQLCARLLGELGADVIKVEPRDGDPTRNNGPFFRGESGPESSLWWWAMNAGKRSVTAELRIDAGRDLVRRLIQSADLIVETFAPGKAREAGLDYPSVAVANPGAVLVSITSFGQTGPYKDWVATDIVGVAMGGHMYLNGDSERGPVRTLAPQAYAQANVQACVGALTAMYARGVNDGRGQHVDVSMQEAVANAMDNAQQTWDIRRVNATGPGVNRNIAGIPAGRYLFEARDGWITALGAGGLMGASSGPMIDWLAATGEAGGLDSADWRTKLAAMLPLTAEERAHVEQTLAAFCKTRDKEELVAEAQARNSGWAPVFSPREIVESKQLAGREYWVSVKHEDIGESFVYPGAPFLLSETPWAQRGRAPHIGEHNQQVYGELLGLSEGDLRRLKMRMVV
jgi:crotonobetainyl-CoA:carnitine CoA-transferase CaiB-like acyl-CoA transferase